MKLAWEDYRSEIAGKNQMILQLALSKQAAELQAAAAVVASNRNQEHETVLKALRAKSQGEMDAIREEADRRMDIFEAVDLEAAASSVIKAPIVAIKATKATNQMMQEFEDAINN